MRSGTKARVKSEGSAGVNLQAEPAVELGECCFFAVGCWYQLTCAMPITNNGRGMCQRFNGVHRDNLRRGL